MRPTSLENLSNSALVSSLSDLRSKQRADDVEFLWFLGEVDHRRCFAELGYDSLWAFCRDELRLTNGTAARRIHSARLLRRFPAAAAYLADGRLSLASFSTLRDLLTEENLLRILDAASFKTEDEVQGLVATYLPLSVSRTVTVKHILAKELELSLPEAPAPSPSAAATPAAPAPTVTAVLPPPPPTVKVLSAEYFSLTLRVPPEFMDLLGQVTDALSHSVPSADKVEVLATCMRHLLDHRARKAHGLPARRSEPTTPSLGVPAPTEPTPSLGVPEPTEPTPSVGVPAPTEPTPSLGVATPERSRPSRNARSNVQPPTSNRAQSALPLETTSRHVPADVARAVWERDCGRCTFVGANGRRCGSTRHLQLHHLAAYALGGPTTADNLTLHCAVHNRLQAERDFGSEWMAQFTRRSEAPHAERTPTFNV